MASLSYLPDRYRPTPCGRIIELRKNVEQLQAQFRQNTEDLRLLRTQRHQVCEIRQLEEESTIHEHYTELMRTVEKLSEQVALLRRADLHTVYVPNEWVDELRVQQTQQAAHVEALRRKRKEILFRILQEAPNNPLLRNELQQQFSDLFRILGNMASRRGGSP